MNRVVVLSGVFALGMAVGLSAGFARPQAPQYQTKQVLQTDLSNLAGQEILVFASTWQPGFRLPLHKHPNGHEITYVVEGELTFEVEGFGTRIVKAGEAIYTPPNTPHFGRNASDKVTKTVVIRVKDKDKPITVEIQ